MRFKYFPLKIRNDIFKYVRKNGYVCYYTKMPLEMHDPKSPWYYIDQLANYKKNRIKIKKKHLVYWDKLNS